jgi:hypothetical protein
VFEFGYMTGARADALVQGAGDVSAGAIRAQVPAAERLVDARNKGKQLKKDQRAKEIYAEASRLAAEMTGGESSRSPLAAMRQTIDEIVVHWSGKDKAGKPFDMHFPEAGRASDFLAFGDQAKVYEAIRDRLGELAHLGADETKN